MNNTDYEYIEAMRRRFDEADAASVRLEIVGAVVIQTLITPLRVYFLGKMLHKTAAADLDLVALRTKDEIERSISECKREIYRRLTYEPSAHF